MNRLALALVAALALSSAALAAPEPAPAPGSDAPPAVLMLPMKTVVALRQYLGARPHDETSALISAIQECAQVQIPIGGVIRSNGQCPEVTAAQQARDAAKPKQEGKAPPPPVNSEIQNPPLPPGSMVK